MSFPPNSEVTLDAPAVGGDSQGDNGLANGMPATAESREGGGLLSFDAESQDWQMDNGEPEKMPEELKDDLRQLEDEINTLKHVLSVKERKANDIRRKLGITPLQLISDSFYGGIKTLATSSTVQKTSENVKYFGQSYIVPGSKSAASYTKSGLSSMVSGMGSIKNSKIFSSMYGFKPNPAEEEKFVEVIAPADQSNGDTTTAAADTPESNMGKDPSVAST